MFIKPKNLNINITKLTNVIKMFNERIPMICPVGLEFDRVAAGRKYPVNFLHIVHSKPGERGVDGEATIFANKVIKTAFSPYKEWITDVLDLRECIKTLKEIVEEEKDAKRIYINVGTCSKIFAIAAIYVASLEPNRITLFYPKADVYIVMDVIKTIKDALEGEFEKHKKDLEELVELYESHGWTMCNQSKGKGFYDFDIIDVPIIPFKPLGRLQKRILTELYEKESFNSISDLIMALGKKRFSEQSVSRALRQLQGLGLVEVLGTKREKTPRITLAGNVYVETFLTK